MDLQTVFYIVATIFMVLFIIGITVFIYLLFQLKKMIGEFFVISNLIQSKINDVRPVSSLVHIAEQGASYVVNKLKNKNKA